MVVVPSTITPEVEGLLYQSPSTKLIVNDQELGTATLYITETNVIWGGGSGANNPTVTLLYPNISLHAVQREPSPALYMVINYELRLPALTQQSGSGDANEDDDEEFDAEDQPITQLRFVPQNESDLQAIYSALSQGQSLNPDPADEVDEEDPYMDGEEFDEADEEFEDAEESNTAEDAASRLRHMRLEQNTNGTHHYEDCDDAEIEE